MNSAVLEEKYHMTLDEFVKQYKDYQEKAKILEKRI